MATPCLTLCASTCMEGRGTLSLWDMLCPPLHDVEDSIPFKIGRWA